MADHAIGTVVGRQNATADQHASARQRGRAEYLAQPSAVRCGLSVGNVDDLGLLGVAHVAGVRDQPQQRVRNLCCEIGANGVAR